MTVATVQAVVPSLEPRPVSRAKRAFDVLLACAGLALSSPLWVLVAAAIKLEDGGPVFYGQARVAQGGGTFRVQKFRSMVSDAERLTGAVWASSRDPRVTRVGRLLRATALDELPQLLSIFKGDMSLVGPRPERPEFVRQFAKDIPRYLERFGARPGLTGLAQIYGQYDSPPRRKLRYDLLYIRRQSFWLDVKLVGLSFWITFMGRGEHRGRKL
ncbi:MAG: sugar transferase [Candidatus Rokubacteria bacterium]|nr:sugar transferase [Candidatus Rokubacteria bacterium]